MNRGRPRTTIGTCGEIHTAEVGRRYRASTRYRDLDGRLRKVTATAQSRRAAEALLRERLVERPGYGFGGVLSASSSFTDLAGLWLEDPPASDRRDRCRGQRAHHLRQP